MHGIRRYLSQSWGEWLLLLLACTALFATSCLGFHFVDEQKYNYLLMVLVEAVSLALLFVVGYSKKTVLIGSILVVLLLAVVFGGGSVLSGNNLLADSYDNPFLFYFLGFGIAMLAYLCSRWRPSLVVGILLGVIVCCAVQFLYLNDAIVALLLYLFASVALLVLKIFQSHAPRREEEHSAAPWVLASGAALAALALGVAAALFVFVIAPLEPPARELKLITEYYSLEEVHVNSRYWMEEVYDEETSDVTGDETDLTNSLEDYLQNYLGNQQSDEEQGQEEEIPAEESGYDLDGMGDELGALWYFNTIPLLLVIALLLLVLIVASILIKRALRARWFRRVSSRPKDEQAIAFYVFFTKRFALLGSKLSPSLTPYEYMARLKPVCRFFEDGVEGGSFATMTDAYVKTIYGQLEPTNDEIACNHALYRGFYRRAVAYVGRMKYLLYFFRL